MLKGAVSQQVHQGLVSASNLLRIRALLAGGIEIASVGACHHSPQSPSRAGIDQRREGAALVLCLVAMGAGVSGLTGESWWHAPGDSPTGLLSTDRVSLPRTPPGRSSGFEERASLAAA